MLRHVTSTICFVVLSLCSYAQLPQISFYQLDSLQKTESRNVVVLIHTDWCKYCRAMEETTFKNPAVVKILSSKFYFVTLNAEEKHDIFFNGHTFKFKPTGSGIGVHELAEQLGTVKGDMVFPTLCFLNSKNEIFYQNRDYINARDLKAILDKIK